LKVTDQPRAVKSPPVTPPADPSSSQDVISSCPGGKRVRFAARRQFNAVSRWIRPGIHTYCASAEEERLGWTRWRRLCALSDCCIRAQDLIADLDAMDRSSDSLPRKSALRSANAEGSPKKRVRFSNVNNRRTVKRWMVSGIDRISFEVAHPSTGGHRTKAWSKVDGGGLRPILDPGHRAAARHASHLTMAFGGCTEVATRVTTDCGGWWWAYAHKNIRAIVPSPCKSSQGGLHVLMARWLAEATGGRGG
ncbi:hypothetical protein FQN49_008604, partial [Arthroderma sp. PD_2]